MRWQAHLLLAIVAGLALLPGCVDDAFEDGEAPEDGDGDADTYEECDTVVVPFEANGTDWAAARIECEADVAGANDASLSCQQPEEAHLAASTNLTSGEVELRVDDADGELVAEHRLGDTEDEARELAIEAGRAGEWTMTSQRLEGFEGSFQAELACPRG